MKRSPTNTVTVFQRRMLNAGNTSFVVCIGIVRRNYTESVADRIIARMQNGVGFDAAEYATLQAQRNAQFERRMALPIW